MSYLRTKNEVCI